MGNQNSGLSAIETLALSKAVKGKEASAARDEMSLGTHNVNFLVRVAGQLTVGEDYDKAQVNKVDWIGLVSVALSKLNGVTVENLIEEYENLGKVDLKKIKDAAQKKVDALKGKTVQHERGKVTTKLDYEIVEGLDDLEV